MKFFKIYLTIAFLFLFNALSASKPGAITQFLNHKNWNFVENKGQVQSSDIKYYGHQGGVYLYCQPGKISFVFTKTEKIPEQISEATGTTEGESVLFHFGGGRGRNSERETQRERQITTSRASLILLHSNLSAQIFASDQQEYYENYYTTENADNGLSGGQTGVTNVHTFKTITYKDIYPHIDLILHSREEGMKYEFMVHPGGKINDIQIQWNGFDEIKKLKDSKIEYSLAFGETDKSRFFGMDESKPVSFQKGTEIEIKSDFIKTENVIGFELGKYDNSKDLLIDPTLVWGTYFGGSGEEYEYGIAVDKKGNVFITGFTGSSSGIAFGNAYQKNYSGRFYNAFVAKFSNNGQLLWSTYFGGDNSGGNSLATDNSGNVFVTGGGGLATSGAFLTNQIGANMFLAKFSSNGFLKWSTFFGGGANSFVATDKSGNVIITGAAISNSGVATTGAFQLSIAGGGDAFLAKFNTSGQILWGTYFGGVYYDIGTGLATDSQNNIYLVGATESPGMATSNAYQSALNGNSNAFIARFKPDGSRMSTTYFGGINDDAAVGVAIGTNGDYYILGDAGSPGLATIGAYKTSFTGNTYNNEAFLAKFNKNDTLTWCTYYGQPGTLTYSLTSDRKGNAYISGSTSADSGIATHDGYQTDYKGGGYDAYLSEFDKNGKQKWGTYFGREENTFGRGVGVDTSGNIFLAGYTGSSIGIATIYYYNKSTKPRGNGDAFLAKFGLFPDDDAGVDSTINPRGLFCSDTENVMVQIKNYGSAEIDSVLIGWKAHGNLQKPYDWKGKLLPDSVAIVTIGRSYFGPGLDTVVSWTSMPNGQTDSASWNDSNIETLNILPGTNVHIGSGKSICEYDSATINSYLANGDTCLWTSNPAGFRSHLANPVVKPPETTTYYLTEISKSTSCSKTDSLVIKVHQVPPGIASIDTVICSNSGITLRSKPANNAIYIWSSDPVGVGSVNSHFYTRLNQSTTINLIEIDTLYGCTIKDSIYIKVDQSPRLSAGQAGSICAGNSIKLIATPDTLKNYYWKNLSTGFNSFSRTATDSPASTTTYYVTATNTLGCTAIDSVKITVYPLPIADAGGNQTICAGKLISIGDQSIPGTKYLWSSVPAGFNKVSSAAIVDPTITTIYFLKATNIYGCANKDSAMVTVNPIPYVYSGSSMSICAGKLVTIGRGRITGLSYNWSSSPAGFSSTASGNTVSPKITTTYKLAETNIFGCSNEDSLTITVNPLPAANVGIDGRICEGSEAVIGGPRDSGSFYVWYSSPPGFLSYQSNPTVKPDITTIYILTEKSDSGCSKTDSITMVVAPSPVPDVGSNQTICQGTSANIGGPPVSGNSYDWVSFPTGFSSSAADTIVKPDTTTSYILFESGPSGCTRRAYITITVNPYPNARWLSHNVCDTVAFAPLDSNNRHYSWYFGDGDSDLTAVSPVHIYKSKGYDHVRLVIMDSLGCTAKYDSIINIDCVNPQYQDSAFELQFYPNPFHESATLHYLLNNTTHVNVVLYDALGKQVSIVEDRTDGKGVYTMEINTMNLHLAHGVYFLVFRSDDGDKTLKIIAL